VAHFSWLGLMQYGSSKWASLGLRMACSVVLVTVALGAHAQVAIKGAGATFPSKVYERWITRFQQEHPEVALSYAATGSGDGVKQVQARAVQFGGSDSPLSAQQLLEHKLVQIPMLIGGLVPVVNVPGVASNHVTISGSVLAEVMAGRISHWDDARITKLNPGVRLPHVPITRIVREDKSGSSEVFTRFLAQSQEAFKAQVEPSQKPAWPTSPGTTTLVAAKGNDGVSALLKATKGGISYVSFDRVARDGLTALRLRNGSGADVMASEEAFKAAVLASDVYRMGDDNASLLNQPRIDAWPLTATSFVLLDARPKDLKGAEWAARFVYWCFMHGDDLTRGTGFAAMPSRVQAKLSGRLMQIQGPRGELPQFTVF
jgi:phosphate transport system substrate-binding protein